MELAFKHGIQKEEVINFLPIFISEFCNFKVERQFKHDYDILCIQFNSLRINLEKKWN